ncbi:MAG TPA: SpoIIE family protein phosphatase [Acidisarcina sp.]|nr:SpoIIE family protein phosphatase [Acidisarcina sp.]
MASVFSSIEARIYRVFDRQPPQGRLHRAAFWLLIVYLVLCATGFLPGIIGGFSRGLRGWVLFALAIISLWLGARGLSRNMLWKVRNRLIVTYLLMALAPIVLFTILALAAAYVFSGEFAIFAVTSEMHRELAHLEAENQAFAIHVSHVLDDNPGIRSVSLPERNIQGRDHIEPGLEMAAFRDGKRVPLDGVANGAQTLESPAWASNGFSGIVVDKGSLYLRAFHSISSGGHETVVITSVPLSKESADQIATGLGMVTVLPFFDLGEEGTGSDRATASSGKRSGFKFNGEDLGDTGPATGRVTGGKPPRAEHFYDIAIDFFAPLSTTDWHTGQPHFIGILVNSEPTLLYRRLVITSLKGQSIFQTLLIGLAIFFGMLELVAFIMAVRLNRTITQSVHDLYEATREVDRGNFSHRIPVRRKDQLAALSGSFNSMTSSLEGLLQEQREKERLQNELDIAQEVQANLFPRDDVSLPSLELHGICRPARTVSGDYYDFLLFGKSGVGLALGDISGKGISAALLMATLHSAVRAYRFAGEELVHEGVRALHAAQASSLDGAKGVEEIDCGEWFESPGKILALLNRHLYRSTQPEKYATLFLAHYQSESSRLTYSNGGQLPPLLLRRDDSVVRLDRGGTVVGLIDGMTYEEGSVQMKHGDILVAYSDGVTEPENDFGDFGEDRLIEIVRRNRYLPLPVICEQVMQALRDWIGAQEQPDDITLVLARQV